MWNLLNEQRPLGVEEAPLQSQGPIDLVAHVCILHHLKIERSGGRAKRPRLRTLELLVLSLGGGSDLSMHTYSPGSYKKAQKLVGR